MSTPARLHPVRARALARLLHPVAAAGLVSLPAGEVMLGGVDGDQSFHCRPGGLIDGVRTTIRVPGAAWTAKLVVVLSGRG